MAESMEEQAALGLAAFDMVVELMEYLRSTDPKMDEKGQSIMLHARDRLHRLGPHPEVLQGPAYRAVEGAIQRWIAARPPAGSVRRT